MKHHVAPETIAALPDTPGVYFFYGSLGELLYVGKSKMIRTRVRSHFSAPEERWLYRKVYRIDYRETAGELGALLLESRLIKELKPMFNVASRQRRRLIVARRSLNAQGYTVVNLEAVDHLDVAGSQPILGVFKHKTQAKEFLATIARTHRLCPKLLRLEVAKTYCFSYHLGQCGGACMGEEDPGQYNARVEQAFDARRVKAWPYEGGIAVAEQSPDGSRREIFVIDNWCLLASFRSVGGTFEPDTYGQHRFDYDTYKLLFVFLTDQQTKLTITPFDPAKLTTMAQKGVFNDLPISSSPSKT